MHQSVMGYGFNGHHEPTCGTCRKRRRCGNVGRWCIRYEYENAACGPIRHQDGETPEDGGDGPQTPREGARGA